MQPVPGRHGRPARRLLIRHRIVVLSAAAILSVLAIYLPLTLLAPLAPTSAQLVPFVAPDRTATHAMLPAYGASAVGAIGYPEAFASAGSTEPSRSRCAYDAAGTADSGAAVPGKLANRLLKLRFSK